MELDDIYENGNIMVVEVTGPYGMKEIGCNSLWCFTYGGGANWQTFDNHSTNGIVYAIIDFSQSSDSPDFMHVLIKPLIYDETTPGSDEFTGEEENDNKLYNMANESVNEAGYSPIDFIEQKIGIDNAKKLLTFGEEPVYDNAPNSEWPYKNPNQLAMDLKEIRMVARAVINRI